MNERLAKEEAERGDADRLYPKGPWPPPEMCPLCWAPTLEASSAPTWNEAEVSRFLEVYFYANVDLPVLAHARARAVARCARVSRVIGSWSLRKAMGSQHCQ